MTIKVSVIIPVYNTENYLEKCLDSVINQKLKDIEIICINDGSTDNSLKILEKYAEKDDRIVLINKKNTGIGASRNIGMKYATGEYIAFLDSDDWLNDNIYDFLYNSAELYNSDVVMHKLILYSDDEDKFFSNDHYDLKEMISLFNNDSVYSYKDFSKWLFEIPREAYTMFYRRDFLNELGVRFPEGLFFEDNPFFFEVILNAKKIFLLDKYGIVRRIRNDSIVFSKDKRYFDVIKITNLVFGIFKKNNLYEKYKKEIINNKFNRIFYFVYGRINKEYKSDYFDLIKDDFCKISKNPKQHRDFILNLDKDFLSLYFAVLDYKFKEFDLFYENLMLKNENNRFKEDKNILKKRVDFLENNYKSRKKYYNNLKNNLTSAKNVIKEKNDFLKIMENDLKSKNLELKKLSENIEELTIFANEIAYTNNKSLKNKIISAFSDLYILIKSNGSFKNRILNIKGYKSIKTNCLFDIGYYLKNNIDVKRSGADPLIHYILFGYKEGRKPNLNFNGNFYLKNYPDVKSSSLNPLIHYALYGKQEGRIINKKQKNVKSDKKNPSFTKFSNFLSNSILSPLVSAPFKEGEKRCFAVMDNIAKYLINNVLINEDKPLVSVVMPVYNRSGIIGNAINSVLNQTYENIELIIVNDGSDDGTLEIIESINDDRILLVNNDSNVGVSKSRNIGFKHSKGDYIAYLDSDNDWNEKYIESMIGAFFELKDADLIYSGQFLFNKNDEDPFEVRFGSFNKSLLANRNYIDLNCVCHTRNSFIEVNGFDESLKRLVDWDFLIKMSENHKIYSVPVLLSNYYYNMAENRISDDSNFKTSIDMIFKNRKERVENIRKEFLTKKNCLNKNVSIIIPNYESLEDIIECINSIISLKMENSLEIIVVDNNSNNAVVDYLKNLKNDGVIKLLLNDINYGFTYAVNQGIDISNPENDILILNNDASLTPGALNSLQDQAYKLLDCGITVPQQVLPKGNKSISKHVPYATDKRECDVNISVIHDNIAHVPTFHSGEILELDFAPFFCTYIKREVLNKFISLDSELGRHYRSDRIFSYYMRHILNMKIYYISDAVVYHKHKQSTNVLKKNKKEFNTIFIKNQWEKELADELGYKNPIWDF